jgi:hypothetical protein
LNYRCFDFIEAEPADPRTKNGPRVTRAPVVLRLMI